jgi:phage terminase small subunit
MAAKPRPIAARNRNEFGLTPREESFAQSFAECKNAAEAARTAGAPPKASAAVGAELLGRPQVQARVGALLREQSRNARITADEVMLELKRIALLDPADLYRPDGTLLNIHEMPLHARRAIREVEVVEQFERVDGQRVFTGYARKVKVFDKLNAIQMAMKNLGLLVDKLEVAGTLTLDTLVTQSYLKPGGDDE